jgi:NTE family protein
MDREDTALPVERIPTDPKVFTPTSGTALCLSGGGYRAMLFHLGALWRLNLAGYLPKIDHVSSVSGGSITAGVLALAWEAIAFDDQGVGQQFEREMVVPIRNLAGITVDLPAVIKGLLGPGDASDQVAKAYREHLYGERTLQDLPDERTGPRFVFNATNLQSGALWRFTRRYMRDYRVGEVRNPTLPVAVAVAASSSFPPFLSPTVLRLKESAYTPDSGLDMQRKPFTTKVVLTDGGVYDNLGLETAWKNYTTVLVSDGGGRIAPKGTIGRDYFRHTLRVLDTVDNQVRSLRKRQLIDSFELDEAHPNHRRGTYWGTYTDIRDFKLADAFECPVEQTMALARIPTRLARMPSVQQERLINWGFAVCDAAMRTWVDRSLPRPGQLPYPSAGVG